MSLTPRRALWLIPVVLLVAWLGIGGTLGPYAGRLGEVSTNDQAAFLPRSAESTKVVAQQRAFQQAGTLPAIVVWTVDGDASTAGARQSAATRALASLAGTPGVVGGRHPPCRHGTARHWKASSSSGPTSASGFPTPSTAFVPPPQPSPVRPRGSPDPQPVRPTSATPSPESTDCSSGWPWRPSS